MQNLIRVYLINSFEQHVDKAILYGQQPNSIPLVDPTMLDLMIKDQIDLRNKDFTQAMEDFMDASDEGDEARRLYEKNYKLIYASLNTFFQEKPCIFFMDEPDLSMHIDWKEILVKELHELNPNMQIILSTHAPSVITGWHDKVKEVNQLIKK